MPFPYVMTLHQAPTDDGDYDGFHFHIECPPATAQAAPAEVPRRARDWRRQLPERHAARGEGGRAARVPDVHYKRGTPWLTRSRCLRRSCELHDARPRRRGRRDGASGADGSPASTARKKATRSTRSIVVSEDVWSSGSRETARGAAVVRAGCRRAARRTAVVLPERHRRDDAPPGASSSTRSTARAASCTRSAAPGS